MTDDKQLREMTCNSEGSQSSGVRHHNPTGQALVRALVSAGRRIRYGPDTLNPRKRCPASQKAAALGARDSHSARCHELRLGEASRRADRANLDILITMRSSTGRIGNQRALGSRDRARRNGRQLFRSVATGAGIRPSPAGAQRRWAVERAGLGERSVCLRAANFPRPRHVFGIQSSDIFAFAVPACRNATVGRARHQHLPGPIDDEWNQTLPLPKPQSGRARARDRESTAGGY